MFSRIFLALGAILAGLSVAGGAFATHALKAQLSDKALALFETGARYQMYHAIALVVIGVLLQQNQLPPTLLVGAGYAFCLGIVLFCGSLYGLSLSDVKALGAIAPLGGAAFLIGWICLATAAILSQ